MRQLGFPGKPRIRQNRPGSAARGVWTGANQFGILGERVVPPLGVDGASFWRSPTAISDAWPGLGCAGAWGTASRPGHIFPWGASQSHRSFQLLVQSSHDDETTGGSEFARSRLPSRVFLNRPTPTSISTSKPLQFGSAGIIERMEAAFYCNDTPFIDQVRLPMAALWGGRVKLVGFESDVTTANFVLGLPGAGLLPSLSMTGSGHLATRTPPSDQLVGVHMTFNLHGSDVEPLDNSGLHGMQFLVRASRGFFQSVVSR